MNKQTIRDIIYRTLGIFDRTLNREANHIILCYHSIAIDNNRFSVTEDEFKKQILLLNETRKHISMKELIDKIRSNDLPKYNTYTITFDDGYKDVLSVKSFLKEQSIKPTIYILPFDAQPNYKELANKFERLSKQEVESLQQDGWEIGSHSYTHANFACLNEENLKHEVIDSKNSLEANLHTQILGFSYPKGKHSALTEKIVKKAKYTYAVTMDDAIISHKTDLFNIPRIGVDRSHNIKSFENTIKPTNIKFRKVIKSLGISGL